MVKTIVFGSRARGDYEPESDLDLVMVEQIGPDTREAISHCAWEIGFDAGRLIQTVVGSAKDLEEGPESSSLFMIPVQEEGVQV